MKKTLSAILLSIIIFVANSSSTKAQSLPGSCPEGMYFDTDLLYCVMLEEAVIVCDSGSSGYCFVLEYKPDLNWYCPWDCVWTVKGSDYCSRILAVLFNLCGSLGQ
jgi:hypothetical protein